MLALSVWLCNFSSIVNICMPALCIWLQVTYVMEVMTSHGVTCHLQCVYVADTHAVYRKHIAELEPTALLSWSLTSAQMKLLDSLDDGHKYCWDPKVVQ